ncbi:cell division protein FtsH, partial [Bifidobacterium thermophilum]|nr:cell division protein FtsH [Bifidobacterium thermophilum]
DLIAKTLLEVETLDAEQIKHLSDHGKLPDRAVKQIETSDDMKVKINIKKDDENNGEGEITEVRENKSPAEEENP